VGVNEHDGFYLRLALGYAHLDAKSKLTEAPERELEISGGGAVFQLAIGGSPTPGFVIGGMLLGHAFANPDVESDDVTVTQSGDRTFSVSAIGPFLQYYFDPKSGFYLQGFLGYVEARAQYEIGGLEYESEDATGAGFGFGLGYDIWVSDQWSIGPEVRLLYADVKYSGDGPDEEDTLVIPSLSFAATFH
jgi:outer membrane autotransporter protein